jgi:hypothetical protein
MLEKARGVSDSRLKTVEEALGFVLADDLKAFYRKSDGGIFALDLVDLGDGQTTIFNTAFSVSSDEFENAVEEYQALREDNRIPRLSLPFADDPSGNYFLVSHEADTLGQIFFWDHDREVHTDGDAIADFSNMRLVAPSFSAFVASLKDSGDV